MFVEGYARVRIMEAFVGKELRERPWFTSVSLEEDEKEGGGKGGWGWREWKRRTRIYINRCQVCGHRNHRCTSQVNLSGPRYDSKRMWGEGRSSSRSSSSSSCSGSSGRKGWVEALPFSLDVLGVRELEEEQERKRRAKEAKEDREEAEREKERRKERRKKEDVKKAEPVEG